MNKLDKMIVKMWRDLGFFYDTDEDKKLWLITGSIKGIKKFIKILKDYSENEKNKKISEHDHYGPYGYLKITTSKEAKIGKDQIEGNLEDIKRLAELIEKNLKKGKNFTLNKEYSNKNNYKLQIKIKPQGFDPASADPSIKIL